MNQKRANLFALAALAVCPIAFAQEAAPQTEAAEERICVNTRAIRTFDALTDMYVYVREGSNKHYLFTMRNRCHNLRDALGIAIKDTTSRICADGFGEIVYRDRMGGKRLESCVIGTIERVDSKDDAKAIVAARTAKQDEADEL